MVGSLILGFFDGVHIGHREVISSAVSSCMGRNTALVTLKDSPSLYFNHNVEYIRPRKKSIEIIKSLGVDEILELDFEKVVDINADFFLRYVTNKYSPSNIFTGFNHTFGFNKKGNPEFLKANAPKYGYIYHCIPEYKYEGETVSSTTIRQYLRDGNIEKANTLLGDKFSLEGIVIRGAEIGRAIGFPTANIKYSEKTVKLPYGVYKAVVKLDQEYKAIVNWGVKPTVNNTSEPVVEAHILGFDGNLYGETIQINILKRIREERKFENTEELKIQIEKDLAEC